MALPKKKGEAGNAPFSAIGRHGLGRAAYCAGRTIDDLVNDWRVETEIFDHMQKEARLSGDASGSEHNLAGR
jgi:hypothetical protein